MTKQTNMLPRAATLALASALMWGQPVAIAAAQVVPAQAGQTQPSALTSGELAAIDAAVAKALADTGVPGAQVAVVRDGRIILSKGYGRASDALGAMTADQQLPIASNSKQFLGALLLLLEAEGRLSLDDRVSRWMPDVSGADRMTVRQLLAHTSGLQDYWPQDYMFAAMTSAVTPEAIIARWGRQPLDYDPGTQWQYSNTGYVVAGRIAEKAGGAPLWDQFERRLFRPLGMKVVSQDDAIGTRYPVGHIRAALGPVRQATPPARGWLWAAGEFATSAHDLALWNIARMNRTVLPTALWAAQEVPERLIDGRSTDYGLGVGVRTIGGRTVITHTGGAEGYFSINSVWPRERIAVTVLTNGSFSGASGGIHDAIAGIILPRVQTVAVMESDRLADARSVLDAMVAGRTDPRWFTDNWRGYFTKDVQEDYRTSLTAMGPIESFEAAGQPRPRGGFVQRRYTVKFRDRTVSVNSYAEPGAMGRWEQFLIDP